ncbi:hypothetical protein ACLOJK_004155 [Asimina triloba]
MNLVLDFDSYEFGEDKEEDVAIIGSHGKRAASSSVNSKTSSIPPKKPKQKGPMDMFCIPYIEKVVEKRKAKKGQQTTINDAYKKEARGLPYIDDGNEWFIGNMEGESDAEDDYVFEDDSLSWGDVAGATGVEEPTCHVRSTSITRSSKFTSSSSSVNPIEIEDEESESEEEVEEY